MRDYNKINMDLHIQLGLIAFLGMVIEVLAKYKALREKANAANVSLSFRNFLKQDWIALCISGVSIVLALLVLDNIVNLHVNMMKWVKFLFAFVGFASCNLILRLGSAANKKLNNIIDVATGYRETKLDINTGLEKLPKDTAG